MAYTTMKTDTATMSDKDLCSVVQEKLRFEPSFDITVRVKDGIVTLPVQ